MKKSFSTSADVKKLRISAKMSNHEVINESSLLAPKYVIYVVSFHTFYKVWSVKKRYSNFEDLHRKLAPKIQSLPELPPKRLFKNSEEVIKERKQMFENYLNYLFKNTNICNYLEILEFIEMERDLLSLLLKNSTMLENTSSLLGLKNQNSQRNLHSNMSGDILKKSRSVDDSNLNENYYCSFLDYRSKIQEKSSPPTHEKSANMLVVEEFLRNLEFKCENKIDVVKTFEQFLKNKKQFPSFKRDELMKLFYGECLLTSSSISGGISSIGSETSVCSIHKPLKGLMFHIGNIDQNLLGSEACLEFLCKLIDPQFNPEYDGCVYVLKTSKMEHIHYMRLSEHIKSKKNYFVHYCFRILKAIVYEDKSIMQRLKKIITDPEIIEKFLDWLDSDF
jgi:hypothetical protein